MGNQIEMGSLPFNCAAKPLSNTRHLMLPLASPTPTSRRRRILQVSYTRLSPLFSPITKAVVFLLVLVTMLSANASEFTTADIDDVQLQIAEIEQTSGPFARQLFDPLMALAKKQKTVGDMESAKETLLRAQNIAHRNHGVYTPRQLVVIDEQKRMALADGDFDTANKHRKFAFIVTTQDLGDDDPAVINAYSELAQWYMQSGQTRAARRLLTEAMTLARDLDLDLLPLAVQQHRARRLEGICCRAKSLIKVVNEAANLDEQNENLVSAYIELGDSMTMGRKEELAAQYYAMAARLSPEVISSEPQPIPSRGSIKEQRSAFATQNYQLSRASMGSYSRQELERMTDREVSEDPTRKPGWFIHDPEHEHLGYVEGVVTRYEQSSRSSVSMYGTSEETQSMIGSPILYNSHQLQQLLSSRAYKKLQNYRITFSFTVREDGDLENIIIEDSTAPRKVDRLLKDTLERIYYRPAFVNGAPVKRENVRLTQTFETRQRGLNQ